MSEFKLAPAIKVQKELMQAAIEKLRDLEAIDRLFTFDLTYKKVAQEVAIESYADIMGELRNNLNTIAH